MSFSTGKWPRHLRESIRPAALITTEEANQSVGQGFISVRHEPQVASPAGTLADKLCSFPSTSIRAFSLVCRSCCFCGDQVLPERGAKIRDSETKRADDTRRIRKVETRLSEPESIVTPHPKPLAKFTSHQTELIAMSRTHRCPAAFAACSLQSPGCWMPTSSSR